MGGARVYVLLGAVLVVVALHWATSRLVRKREGYSISEAQSSAASAVNKQNTADLGELQRQVRDLENMRQQIIDIGVGIKANQARMKKMTKQMTQIGPGKTLGSVPVPKAQSQGLQAKAKAEA